MCLQWRDVPGKDTRASRDTIYSSRIKACCGVTIVRRDEIQGRVVPQALGVSICRDFSCTFLIDALFPVTLYV